MSDERRMTFIVVPHGGRDLSTRSFEVSYRRLRLAGGLLLAATILFLTVTISWIWVAAQAARVPYLQREIARLEEQQAQVVQLAEALRRLEAQYAQVRAMLGADRPGDPESVDLPAPGEVEGGPDGGAPAGVAEATIPESWPLTDRGFVTRGHLGKIPGRHPGIDIAVAEGSQVRAAGAGVVTRAAEDSVYGRFLRIRHADGYESVYGHASRLFVRQGQRVARDQVIALSGNTGTSTAPHLHFEIWKDGEPIDPRTVVTAPR